MGPIPVATIQSAYILFSLHLNEIGFDCKVIVAVAKRRRNQPLVNYIDNLHITYYSLLAKHI